MMTPTFTQSITRQRHAEAIGLAERERLAASVATKHGSVFSTVLSGLQKLGPGRRPAPKPHVAASS